MLDIECFTYLNRALESTLAPSIFVYFICIYIYIYIYNRFCCVTGSHARHRVLYLPQPRARVDAGSDYLCLLYMYRDI